MRKITLNALARPALAFLSAALVAGCASGPARNITLIPDATDEISSRDGLFAQEIKWERSKPGCQGDCPTLEVNTLVFAGHPDLTNLVDHALAMMTGTSDTSTPPYDDINEFEEYFWQVAGSRDSVMLAAKLRYRSKFLTVIELDSWQYFTGAAHGVGATQFLNWDNARRTLVPLDQILVPGGKPAFNTALQRAHAQWLARQPDAQSDPDAWARLWPFQPSENYAFTDQGIVVKYDTYQLAPYSYGQPELLIPYRELDGVLRVDYLSMRAG
ncbi:RsiV family protein [Achromobacter sp. F4_2707]|uniref:RsiV family protein n=1 Tax=Achromobacter sp. F4_2707 TaxID=3114286 RepID=UPI0039C6EDCE